MNNSSEIIHQQLKTKTGNEIKSSEHAKTSGMWYFLF